ncbi:MAG: hypothetical protein KAJ01_08165 [Candidatus Hydrogenedentes bacterium]|nr:hypothetical protein [Candidatus Hydrogenedentota bacterium]
MSERCIFDRCWQGQCELDGTGDPPLCEDHRKGKCWCGAQAVRDCAVASSFVCGAPLCADHKCRNVAGGLTGSPGFKHSDEGHRQWEEWKTTQEQL